jgi:hypothetical protein
MFSTAMLTTTLLAVLCASRTSAQLLAQGLPACAQSCTILNQAATACGGLASANQVIWSCFCQSAYLTTLHSSPSGICDAFCTDASQNQQIMTWYQGNCGSDNGASEHADDRSGAQTTVTLTSTSSSATAAVGTTATKGAAAIASSTTQSSNGKLSDGSSWWDNHWVRLQPQVFLTYKAADKLSEMDRHAHSPRDRARSDRHPCDLAEEAPRSQTRPA